MQSIRLLGVLWLISCSALQAQSPTHTQIDQLVFTMAELIKEHYVLPERGEVIAEQFLQDLKEGRFYEAQSLKELDSEMTKSLREASGDFHLYTWNNYDLVRQLQTELKEEEEASNFFNNAEAYTTNFGFTHLEILPSNVGYFRLSSINISEHSLETLYAAMRMVSHTRALIIDLRDNQGGGSSVGSVLETFFLEEPTDLLEFRSRQGSTQLESTVPWLLEPRYTKPLYVLTNDGTASAAEAFAFALQAQGRCVVVGEPSSGGAYMNDYFPVNPDFVISISTSAPFLPGTDTSWDGVGVLPDHEVPSQEALAKALALLGAE